MATVEDIRAVARDLPRSYERVVGDRLKLKVGQYVYASLSRDETLLGFAFPREERAALVAGDPERFLMPLRSDERYNWVRVRMDAIDAEEAAELIRDAWRMVVPKRLALETLGE
jgi:hypothetical protein